MTDIIRISGGGDLSAPNSGPSTDELIEQYLLDTQDLAETSKARYRKSLKRYFAWVAGRGLNIKTITLTEILQYKKSLIDTTLADGSSLSEMTIGTYLVAVKGFYTWANAKGFPYNPAATLKSPKKSGKFKREYIPEDKLLLLFEYFEKTSIRNYTIAKTLYYCGLRTIELVRLNWGDIAFEKGRRVIWVQGKGKKSKDASVNLTEKSYAVIEAYMNHKLEKYGNQAIVADMPLFSSEDSVGPGTRLITGTISSIIKTGLRAIGMDDPKWTAHSIRHSAGTIAMMKGATKEDVRDMLRHSSTTITDNYTKAIDRDNRLKNSAEDLL